MADGSEFAEPSFKRPILELDQAITHMETGAQYPFAVDLGHGCIMECSEAADCNDILRRLRGHRQLLAISKMDQDPVRDVTRPVKINPQVKEILDAML